MTDGIPGDGFEKPEDAKRPSGVICSTPPPVSYEQHERELLKIIDERDYWEDMATTLANKVGEYFGIDVGEHSNLNCPVQKAIEHMDEIFNPKRIEIPYQ